MASLGDAYLPDLARCLAGKLKVISWDDVLHELLRHQDGPFADPFSSFLRCDSSKAILSQEVPSFGLPSPESKIGLETRTAPINLPPSVGDPEVIEEIKSDALWLSREAKIDEVEALRIIVLDWQRRPQTHLRNGSSETELASLRDALGSGFDFQGPFVPREEHSASELNAQDRRRSSIFRTFLTEQNGLLGTLVQLLQRALIGLGLSPGGDSQQGLEHGMPRDDVLRLAHDLFPYLRQDSSRKQRLSIYITAVQHIIEDNEHHEDCITSQALREHISRYRRISHIKEMVTLMDIILLHVRSASSLLSTSIVLSWFACMKRCNFFADIGDWPDETWTLFKALQSSTAIVSLAVLNPATSIGHILEAPDKETLQLQLNLESLPYFLQPEAATEIHDALSQAAVASVVQAVPAMFAWGLVLYSMRDIGQSLKEEREGRHVQRAIDQGPGSDTQTGRRSSTSSIGSIQQSAYEDVLDHIIHYFDEPPIDFMIESSFSNDLVFNVITELSASCGSRSSLTGAYKLGALQDLVKMALPVLDYSAQILNSQLAILGLAAGGSEPFAAAQSRIASSATLFLKDDFLTQELFEVSAARFPFETLPFLRLCRALLSAEVFTDSGLHYIANKLKHMTSFTKEASAAGSAFRTIREDENANLVCLEQDLSMLGQTGLRLLSSHTNGAELTCRIPAGVTGEVISESPPPVIKWFHAYSGLTLLGALLDLHRDGRLESEFSISQSSNLLISETIELLAGLLSISIITGSTQSHGEYAMSLLEECGNALPHDDDIITVISDIFEAELQALRHHLDRDGACDILVACAKFMLAIAQLLPDRVWRTLFRSSLLDPHGNDGTLVTIIGSSPAHTGAAEFFEICTLLYSLLIDDSLSHITGKVRYTASDRSRKQHAVKAEVTNDLMSMQLSSFTQVMLDTLDSTSGSLWQCPAQEYRVTRNLLQSFQKVLHYTYGTDDSTDLREKVTAVLAPSALYVAQSYCGGTANDASIIPPILCIVMGVQGLDIRLEDASPLAREQCLTSALSLCTWLVRLETLEHGSSCLQKQLLSVIPAIIRLLTIRSTVAIHSLLLMSTLLAACVSSQPASLLGYLGSSSKSFLELLCSLATTGHNPQIRSEAWKLSKQLVGKDQQWLAMMLLTGSSPQGLRDSGEATNVSGDHRLRSSALLSEAVDALSDLDSLDIVEAVSVLQFVAVAQENWIWAQNSLQSHPSFFSTITAYVSNLNLQGDSVQQSYRTQIASLVTQILTVHLYQARPTRDLSMIKRMMPFINWLARNAVEVSAYNASLHANLRKNFSAKFGHFFLDNFKRTVLADAPFGRQYFYDIDLADKILFRTQPRNTRNGVSAGQSFSDEMSRANLNLSLVQSQIALLHSFKALCVEHSAAFMPDRELQKLMCHIVQRCIQSNTHDRPPEKIFETLFTTRADFALALIRPLAEVNAKGSDFMDLFEGAWEYLRFDGASFESALTGGSLSYYRSNLSILLFSMQFHIQKGQRIRSGATEGRSLTPVNAFDSVILEIASLCVAEGLHTVVGSLHDQLQNTSSAAQLSDNAEVGVKDVQLLLNIMQSLLRLPAMPHLISQLSGRLSSSNLIQSCIRLYSWSHVLTSPELGSVPIYAELSLQFLASLSSLPPLAEELAVEGILTVISTSRITQSLRSRISGVSPFDKQPHFQTLYRAWSSGILPICLNLLHSVGRAMAGEVTAFLNQFPDQLTRASNTFAMLSGDRLSGAGPITLSMAHEATILALISHISLAYRRAGASAGVDGWEIPALAGYDENKKELIEDIEDLLANRCKNLKARIVAVTDTERGWHGTKENHTLEQKIVAELHCTLLCLKGDVEAEAG